MIDDPTTAAAISAADGAARGAVEGEGAPVVRLLGVRHHGPGSARAVEAVLAGDPPDIVLIEGPSDADGLVALVGERRMRPPVAMLAYVVDRPERAAFHPFASFSPEWVALRWAVRVEVPVRFIDLAARTTLAERPATDEIEFHDGPDRPIDPIGELALAAGYDDPERWWEDIVEHRGSALDAAVPDARSADEAYGVFVAIGEAMAALRSMYEPQGEPRSVSERLREAQMRAGIRSAVKDGFRRIVVVCGAWHVPALADALDSKRARRDAALLRGLPKVKTAITWVPWTHRRLSASLGYGAGVTAPGWYHHLHTHAGPAVIARWFTEAAQIMRRADVAVSAADVVEATRLADALAVLRNRPLAGLSEVDDAARAVFGHGSDLPLRLISNELVIGTQIGAVPANTPMVPLARSLAAEQKRCRLKPQADVRMLELDLRRPLDTERSRLLHRVVAIGVPWGRISEGRGSTGTFRETWELRWEPDGEVAIIEASAHGTTLPAAAAAALLQRAQPSSSLAELTALLEQALVADLHAAVPELLAAVADRSSLATEVDRLMEVVAPLVRTIRYGDVRNTDGGALQAVVDGIVVRVAAGLVPACTALDDDGSTLMAGLVRSVQSALSLLGNERLMGAWRRALGELVERDRVHGLLQGLATRLLADGGELDPLAVERRVSRSLSVGTPPLEGAAFVEGFLGSSGTALVHDPQLLGAFDRWLATLPIDAFTEVLPLLRRTFGAFEPAERRAVGERVRTGDAPGTRSVGAELDPQRVAAGLATVAALLGGPR